MKKEGKKWMLVALALLALVMVALPLVGCKNDTVAEQTGGNAEPARYTVTFNSNGGTGTMNPQSFTAGEKLAANTFTRTGFVFVGWSEDSKATSATYGDKAKFTATKDTTLYAVWIQLLTFTSDSDTHLRVTYNGSIDVPDGMAYSTDGKTWTDFKKPRDQIPFGNGTELYLRGKSSTGTARDHLNFVKFKFKGGTKVYASGDIRTLVDWQNPTTANTSGARFCSLFRLCYELVTAPELPATTLADFCYEYMFSGCTGLITAPKLEAETLTAGCYYYMFEDCTSLTTAPELPATTLASNCYEGMFFGCTQLASVTMLATDVRAYRALAHWLGASAEKGTLYVANNNMVSDTTITGSLPSGKNWTVKAKTN